MPTLLTFSRELAAIAQAGLTIHHLPELDPNRARKEDLLRAYDHFLNPQVSTYFN